MAKISKHKRIKRPTVLIKRTRCVRNTKNKTFFPMYQKLKVNNHSLARALSQEKQESQLLFSRNVQLLSEVQDLALACHSRDIVIANVLKNAKDMMQVLVTMSGFLTNTISCCQEFVSNPNNTHRTSSSSSSPALRESLKRISTKSPAKGVVKPMVSGHTITKPIINLSRVNMQRLQNVNLSIIEEGPNTPHRNSERLDSRRSRTLSERLPASIRTDADGEEIVANRRTSRFSGGRISSRRFSKRKSGRSSGTGLVSRLSMHNSEYSELMKSPRVALQDVSRYLSNSQTVNVRSMTETSTNFQNNNKDDMQVSEPSSPENSSYSTIIPDTQDFCDTSESEQERNHLLRSDKLNSSEKSCSKQNSNRKSLNNCTSSIESDFIDPKEGPSWLYDSDSQLEADASACSKNPMEQSESEEINTSSLSLFSKSQNKSSVYFRIPEMPKSFRKNSASLNLNCDHSSSHSEIELHDNSLDPTSFQENEDDGERNVNFCQFITRRRGCSSRTNSVSYTCNVEDDNDDDDETIMMNIKKQLRPQQQPNQQERLQFDMNELLQLTPLRPLLKIQDSNGLSQVEPDTEHTATVQITQRVQRPQDVSEALDQPIILMNTNKPIELTVKNHELLENEEPKHFGELSTERISSSIELPRITDYRAPEVLNDDQALQNNFTLKRNKRTEKRKRVSEKATELTHSVSEDDEYIPTGRKKKPKQRKKKVQERDPSSAKVVLQKLNETGRTSNQSDTSKTERKFSDDRENSEKNSATFRTEQSSDSESSTASHNSRPMSMRPRRQKAPTNLQEPCLNKKLRRLC